MPDKFYSNKPRQESMLQIQIWTSFLLPAHLRKVTTPWVYHDGVYRNGGTDPFIHNLELDAGGQHPSLAALHPRKEPQIYNRRISGAPVHIL